MITKKLSKRSQQYVYAARHSFYSTEDLLLLYSFIYDSFKREYDSGGSMEHTFSDLETELGGFLKDGYILDSMNSDHIQNEMTQYGDTQYLRLNFIQYLLINYKRVFFFLTCVPLDRVPLFVNDKLLTPFVKWRLTINK